MNNTQSPFFQNRDNQSRRRGLPCPWTRKIPIRTLAIILFTVLTSPLIASASAQPPIPTPPLPPIFTDFNITPTEIELGDYLIISFVIENTNNRTITWMSTNRIGDITQIIEIELENYESKIIWYRIIPHAVGEYDVWIDGLTGTFKVVSTTPLPITNETDPVIIVTDALEELNLKIDYLNTNLQDLTKEFFSLQTDYNVDVDELNSKIDTMETTLETYSNDFNEQIESLEDKISRLQTTILYACIATAIIAIVGAFLLIKRMQ